MTPEALDDLERTLTGGLVLPPATRAEILRLIADHRKVNAAVLGMFEDYYVEYMGSELDWLAEFQARLEGCPR
jgi:hypothetical protein